MTQLNLFAPLTAAPAVARVQAMARKACDDATLVAAALDALDFLNEHAPDLLDRIKSVHKFDDRHIKLCFGKDWAFRTTGVDLEIRSSPTSWGVQYWNDKLRGGGAVGSGFFQNNYPDEDFRFRILSTLRQYLYRCNL